MGYGNSNMCTHMPDSTLRMTSCHSSKNYTLYLIICTKTSDAHTYLSLDTVEINIRQSKVN